MNRNQRAERAKETLQIFDKGMYELDGKTIDCTSRFSSGFMTEDKIREMAPGTRFSSTGYEVVNESVVDTIFRMPGAGVLNFASAKNPGGGFLNGSLAQEESLAISSDLYLSQISLPDYYETNKKSGTALYTHNMIYSKGITFIRDSKGKLVNSPVRANILTCPAVNAGAYYQNESGDRATVLREMEKRIRYLLTVFADQGDTRIILGAFGCGVFRNKASDVAAIFKRLLKDELYERYFEFISFAVFDSKGDTYDIFRQDFGS